MADDHIEDPKGALRDKAQSARAAVSADVRADAGTAAAEAFSTPSPSSSAGSSPAIGRSATSSIAAQSRCASWIRASPSACR
ncbi:hypothetical protein N8D56_08615 [Devosia sp. A8/3-2]|nr:hypothetical protein N8D56_08615 [Devosia sp. A8/3-2]